MPFYAVHKGRQGPAIYQSWPECSKAVKDFHGAIYKKFDSIEEAEKFKAHGFENKPKFLQKREDYESKNQDEINSVFTDNDAYRNLIIYTDGSCIRDGEAKRVYCGYGFLIPELNIKVCEPLKDPKLTNNRAELRAILHAIETVDEESKKSRRLCIFTDSQYCKYIFQGTGARYEKTNFIKDGEEVPNKDMIITALSYIRKYEIVILKVRAHTNETDIHSKYNDLADKLANEGAMKMKMGKKYQENRILEGVPIYHDSILHPFEKREVKRAYTPQVEYSNDSNQEEESETKVYHDTSYRYNQRRDWREEEKKKFENRTKMSDLFDLTDVKSGKEREPTYTVKVVKNKVMKFKNSTLFDFLSPNDD